MSFELNEETPYIYPFQTSSDDLILKVWRKGKIMEGYKPSDWRKDKCGKIMHFTRHGDTDSEFGWEIDHICPTSKGGSDDLSNLQPLQWQNNRKKGDQAIWNCE